MAIDYSGLFANPADIRARRVDELMKQQQAMSMGGGSMSQLLGQVAGGGNVLGSLLAEGIAQQAGLKTQEEKQAETAQNIFQQVNQDDPTSYYKAAQALNDAGLTKASMAMISEGRNLDDRLRRIGMEDRREQRDVEKDARDRVRFNNEQTAFAKTEEEKKLLRKTLKDVPLDTSNPMMYYLNAANALKDAGLGELAEQYLTKAEKWTSDNGDPAKVREFKYIQGLSEEDQKKYFSMVRGASTFSVGDKLYRLNPDGSTTFIANIGVALKDTPEYRAAQAAAEAEGTAVGEKVATAKDRLREGKTAISATKSVISRLLEDDMFESGTGFSSLLAFIPTTDARTVGRLIEQIKGQNFLANVQQMQGLGALSDAEGDAIRASASALEAGMDDDDARIELEILFTNLEKAEQRLNEGNLLTEKQQKDIKAAAVSRSQQSRDVPEAAPYGATQTERSYDMEFDPTTGQMR